MIPKMSENVDSYTTNSFSRFKSPAVEGIATALLIMAKGMANTIAALCSRFKMFSKAQLTVMMLSIKMRAAAAKPFKITGSFSLLISSSNAPSRTIKIRPTVPKTGINLSKNAKSVKP